MEKVNYNKGLVMFPFLLVIVILNSVLVYGDWYRGSTHQHTGFSAGKGYDEDPITRSDGCYSPLEGHSNEGKNVTSLKQAALSKSLSWLTFTDHSYCLNSTEFQTVKTDCDNVKNQDGFTCLSGEELSVSEEVQEKENPLLLLSGCIGKKFGEAHVQAIGINNYIAQDPFGEHCPDVPKAQSAIDQIKGKGGVAVIAHPYAKLVRLDFLDFRSIDRVKDEHGIEIWNGDTFNKYDKLALKKWVESRLLRGVKTSFAFSATDSHDDAEATPYQYVSLSSLNDANLKSALKQGRHGLSNNGELYFTVRGAGASLGDTVTVASGSVITLDINWQNITTSCTLSIKKGDFENKEKEFIVLHNLGSLSGTSSGSVTDTVNTSGYYRLECIEGNKRIYTNPIWVDVKYKLNISNNGNNDLTISSITDNKNWLSTHPSANSLNPIKAGKSKELEILIDYSKIKKTDNTGMITIKSNDPDEPEINVTVTSDKFSAMWSRFSRRGKIHSFWQAKLIIEPNETENLELNLDWLTNDELSVNLTAPDGTIYSANGHPKIINITNPMNGTWIVTVSGNDDLSGLEFGTETDTKPSDIPKKSIAEGPNIVVTLEKTIMIPKIEGGKQNEKIKTKQL